MRNVIFMMLFFVMGLWAEDDTSTSCRLVSSSEYNPVSDGTGKEINTSKEYVYECVDTTKTEVCLKTETTGYDVDTNTTFELPYVTLDFSCQAGGVLGMLQDLKNADRLWTGWKGICTKGVSKDFSWTEDPYFWGSMAVSMIGSGADGQGYAGQIAENASIGGITPNAACVMGATVDAAKTADMYLNPGDPPCDPVDEICSEDDDKSHQARLTKPQTLEIEAYEAMRQNLADSGENPDDYIEVIQNDGLFVAFRFKMPADGGTAADAEAAAEARAEMQRRLLTFQAAMTAGKLAMCYAGSAGSPTDSSSPTSVQNAAMVASSFVPDPTTRLAIQMGVQLASSFEQVNSCNSKADAKKTGSKHEKTYYAKKFGNCAQTSEECVWLLNGECQQTRKYYCCYDEKLTKVLITQMKAQLGKGWAHCSDISLEELQTIDFRQCTEDDMTSGPDGGEYGVSHTDSFQFKQQCVDLGEFKDYLEEVTGMQDIGDADLIDAFERVRPKNPL